MSDLMQYNTGLNFVIEAFHKNTELKKKKKIGVPSTTVSMAATSLIGSNGHLSQINVLSELSPGFLERMMLMWRVILKIIPTHRRVS